MVLYLSLALEIPRVVLKQDVPIPTIEDKIEPQGCAKDAAAHNANLEPFNVAGVDTPMIIRANNNEIDKINDDSDGILLIATIPANNNQDPLILPDTSDSDTLNNEDQNEDKQNNNDILSNNNLLQGDGQEADKLEEGSMDNQDQEVRRSKCNNNGMTAKYADFWPSDEHEKCQRRPELSHLMQRPHIFLGRRPEQCNIPEDNRLEWALGVALVHYSMKAGIKKFQDRRKAGVSKELKRCTTWKCSSRSQEIC
jgi:hypothetical protein